MEPCCFECDRYSYDIRKKLEMKRSSVSWNRHDLISNATLPKGRANKDYENEARRWRYAENGKMSSGRDEFQCHRCRKSYVNLESLNIHMETHCKRKKFQCPKCSYRSAQSWDFSQSHLETHQGNVVFPCYECDFETPNTKELVLHRKEFHQVGNSVDACTVEGSTILEGQGPNKAPSKNLLIFKGYTVAIPTSDTLKSSFELETSASQLSVATKTHEMISKKCQNQKLRSPNQAKSINRQSRSRPKKPFFSCRFCTKIFSCRRNLEVHVRIHTGEKPFRCNLCNYSSNQNSNARRHMKLHRNGKKLILCGICGYAVSSTVALYGHFKKAHQHYSDSSEKLASPEILHKPEFDFKEESQQSVIFKTTSPQQFGDIAEEVKRNYDNATGFPHQQVQKMMEGNYENTDLMELEKKEIETSSKAEVVMTQEVSPKQNSEKKSPLRYKCEFCRFTSKFRIGLNKHVAKSHIDSSTGVNKAGSEQVRGCNKTDEVEEVKVIEISDLNHEQKIVVKVERDCVDGMETELDPLDINEAFHQQEPRTRWEEQTPILSNLDEHTTGNIEQSDGNFTFSIENVRSLNKIHNDNQPGPELTSAINPQQACISEEASGYSSSYSQESISNVKTHVRSHRNSPVSPCKQCDLSLSSQMSNQIRNDIHRIQSNSQSKPPQLPFQNPTLFPVAHSIPTHNSNSNTINSPAPPVSIFTWQLVNQCVPSQEHTSAPNLTRSVTTGFPGDISSSILPSSQFKSGVAGSAAMSHGTWTPRHVPPISSSLHGIMMQRLLGNPPGLNGNLPYINFQPVYQPKLSPHLNLRETNNGSAAMSEAMESKSWTVPGTFVCGFCFLQFKQPDQLVRHKRIHTGEKSYEYDQCDYATNGQQDFIIHGHRQALLL